MFEFDRRNPFALADKQPVAPGEGREEEAGAEEVTRRWESEMNFYEMLVIGAIIVIMFVIPVSLLVVLYRMLRDKRRKD